MAIAHTTAFQELCCSFLNIMEEKFECIYKHIHEPYQQQASKL